MAICLWLGLLASVPACPLAQPALTFFSSPMCVCVFKSKQTVLKRIFSVFFLANFYRDVELICKFIQLSNNIFFLLCFVYRITCKSQHISYGTGKIESNDRNIIEYEREKERMNE